MESQAIFYRDANKCVHDVGPIAGVFANIYTQEYCMNQTSLHSVHLSIDFNSLDFSRDSPIVP